MRHNPLAKGADAGTPSKGNNAPYTKMPVKNYGTQGVSKGSHSGSKIVGSSNGKSPGKAGNINSQKTSTPTTNYVNTTFKHGNTMHGVGQVPAYLKGKQGKNV